MELVNIIPQHFTFFNPFFFNVPGFLNTSFSDVVVTVTYLNFESVSYKLHRIILAGCSSTLNRLLEHDQTLEINFMSQREFELLIIFMYTGSVPFASVAELCAGLYAAITFKLDYLIMKCREKLVEKVQEDCRNALRILQLDERFYYREDNAVLFEMVDYTIKNNYRQMLSSQVIEDLEKRMLQHLLLMDSISDVPEIEVFRALMKWVNARCRRRGIEKVEEKQKLAHYLINNIRYNLIPVEIFTLEVVASELLSENFINKVYQRYHNKELQVPFCTRSRDQEWQLVSTCTSREHLVHRLIQCTTIETLSWNGHGGWSAFYSLAALITSNTRWEVQFVRLADNFGIVVRCRFPEKQFRAAFVRLFAVVENNREAWTEGAAVLKSGEKTHCWFSKQVFELNEDRPLRITVRVQWTELNQMPNISNFFTDGSALMRCHWQLQGWKTVIPTGADWLLFSEPFGQGGALWMISVANKSNGKGRKLMIKVVLQDLPTYINTNGLIMKCSLSLWDQKFVEQKTGMKQNSECEWTVIDDVKTEIRDSLDLHIVIRIIKKK